MTGSGRFSSECLWFNSDRFTQGRRHACREAVFQGQRRLYRHGPYARRVSVWMIWLGDAVASFGICDRIKLGQTAMTDEPPLHSRSETTYHDTLARQRCPRPPMEQARFASACVKAAISY